MVHDVACRGKAADVYALGATLYTLVCGRTPFIATSVHEIFEKHWTEALAFPPGLELTPELKDLLLKMLTKVCSTTLPSSSSFSVSFHYCLKVGFNTSTRNVEKHSLPNQCARARQLIYLQLLDQAVPHDVQHDIGIPYCVHSPSLNSKVPRIIN